MHYCDGRSKAQSSWVYEGVQASSRKTSLLFELESCVAGATPGGCFSAQIPTRHMWMKTSRWRKAAVRFSTNGSNLGGKVGEGNFCMELSVFIMNFIGFLYTTIDRL